MTGRSVAAARLYQYACLISPVAIRPWVYRGQIAANLGQHEDAHRFLTIALAKDPFNEQALATLNRLPRSTRPEAEPARLIPLNSDPRLTQQAYTDWIARYDVLGDEDRVKIRARVESLTPTGKAEVLPLFSLIIPARDPDPD